MSRRWRASCCAEERTSSTIRTNSRRPWNYAGMRSLNRRCGNQHPFCPVTYLDLGSPVPLGASGDEKSPSITVSGDPAGSMPADSHLFQVFSVFTSPCLLPPPILSSAVFWHPVHYCMGRSFSCVVVKLINNYYCFAQR